MATKVVALQDLAKALDIATEAHLESLKKATALGAMKSIPDLVKASPVDTGLYAQSWDFTQTERAVFLGNYAPHAAIIEYGARPFTPPIKPLLEWAKRVLRDPSQPPNYSPAVKSLAYATQKKIAQFGMKPRKVMENMLPTIVENIKEEYRKLGKS